MYCIQDIRQDTKYNLGLSLVNGCGVVKDMRHAVKLHWKVAEQGGEESCMALKLRQEDWHNEA